jgi:hypothetical protein
LEDLLLECGETQYKELKDKAESFRNEAFANARLTAADVAVYGNQGGQKHLSKQKKAWVSAMGAILMPSAAIQNSIRDNRWVEDNALALPRIQELQRFLDGLIA